MRCFEDRKLPCTVSKAEGDNAVMPGVPFNFHPNIIPVASTASIYSEKLVAILEHNGILWWHHDYDNGSKCSWQARTRKRLWMLLILFTLLVWESVL